MGLFGSVWGLLLVGLDSGCSPCCSAADCFRGGQESLQPQTQEVAADL